MAGRPPKPTHLKVLHGDDKKNPKRLNRSEPVPSASTVEPPWQLSRSAQEVWDRLAPDRIDKGVLTAWDADAFAFFCEGVVIARLKLADAGREPMPGAPSPMSELKAAVSILSTLGGRFGWTPSDRTKLTIGEERRGPSEDLLSG